MPVIASGFAPPPGFRNGHVQTLLGALRPRRLSLAYSRERLELSDGDFLDLDWLRQDRDRLAILSHGLEGCSTDASMRGMAEALSKDGWDVLAWNFRGCSGEANRLLRSYHSGETEDLGTVVQEAAKRYRRIALVGFSLGGNVTLKYLGEAPPHPAVQAAAVLSVPLDLASSALALDQRGGNWFYLSRFMRRLTKKVAAKATRFPGQIDVTGIHQVRSFREFDDRFTAPMHNFRDAEDYWHRCSAKPYLPAITVPTLLLNAQNDPFLTTESFPFTEAKLSTHLTLEVPASGGHLGFQDARGSWAESRVAQFLDEAIPTSPL